MVSLALTTQSIATTLPTSMGCYNLLDRGSSLKNDDLKSRCQTEGQNPPEVHNLAEVENLKNLMIQNSISEIWMEKIVDQKWERTQTDFERNLFTNVDDSGNSLKCTLLTISNNNLELNLKKPCDANAANGIICQKC